MKHPRSTGLNKAALLKSVFRCISQVFQDAYDTMVTKYAWNTCILFVFTDSDCFQRVSSLHNTKKMEEKKKTPDQASSLMLKGGGWKGTVRIAPNGLKFWLEHFFNILSQILHLGEDL